MPWTPYDKPFYLRAWAAVSKLGFGISIAVAVQRQPAFHVASYAALLVAAIQSYGMNKTSAAGRLPLWREHKPPTRMSVAQIITNLRSEIEELEMMQSGKIRMNKGGKFLAVLVNGHFGKKFPISTRAIMNNAWT